MRFILAPVLAATVALIFLTSCTGLRLGNPVKASYEREAEDGWILKYIPGLKALSNIVPPPSDARKEWDERQKRQSHQPWEP